MIHRSAIAVAVMVLVALAATGCSDDFPTAPTELVETDSPRETYVWIEPQVVVDGILEMGLGDEVQLTACVRYSNSDHDDC